VLSFLEDFGIRIPPRLTLAPSEKLVFFGGHWEHLERMKDTLQAQHINPNTLPQQTGLFNLVAFLAIIGVTILLVIGIKESANFNSGIVIVKVAIVLMFIVIAGLYALKNPAIVQANWHPFIPPNITGKFGQYGWSGIARGASVIFFAYIGFDAVSTAAQESKNPQKDMPFGILGSLVICTVLYILVAGLLTGIVPYTDLNVSDPVALGIDVTGIAWAKILVKLGAIFGLATVMLVMLLGQLPHAVDIHPAGGWICRGVRGHHSHRNPGRTGEHRYVACVRDCVLWRVDPACTSPRPASAIQDADGSAGADSGRAGLSRFDGQPAAWHLDTAAGVARHRHGHLLRLRTSSQQGAEHVLE
jgi:hypothetical protein